MASDLFVPRMGTPSAPIDPGRSLAFGQSPRMAVAPEAVPEAVGDAGKPMPNPTLRLDPGLALVVIEFRDGAGKVRETIPTEAQLEAYRASQRSSNTPVSPPGLQGREGGPSPQAGSDRPRPVAGLDPGRDTLPDAAPGQRVPATTAPDGSIAVEPRAVVVAQPRGPGDSAVPGIPVKASETGTA